MEGQEPGTGKEVVAKAIWDIHRKDRDKDLNVFDSGTFGDELILSELFGPGTGKERKKRRTEKKGGLNRK